MKNKILKNTLIHVLTTVLLFFLCWLIGGFTSLNWNILEWSSNEREWVVFIVLYANFMWFIHRYIVNA